MKKTGVILLGVFLLVGWLSFSGASSGKTEDCQVVKIIDGDTIDVLYQGEKERIRLLRVDTPERDEEGYFQAKKALKKLVGGREIKLEFEIPGKLERGVYGRILAYVWVDDVNVNIEMVRLGFSLFWTKYGEGKYAEEFRDAERKTDKHYPKDILGAPEGPANNFYVYAYDDNVRNFTISQHRIINSPSTDNPGNNNYKVTGKNTITPPLEHKLAVINAGVYVTVDHTTVARFRDLLQELSNKYPENKQEIADMSVKTQEILKEEGISENLLKIMEGMNQLPPANQKYAESIAAYCALRVLSK